MRVIACTSSFRTDILDFALFLVKSDNFVSPMIFSSISFPFRAQLPDQLFTDHVFPECVCIQKPFVSTRMLM